MINPFQPTVVRGFSKYTRMTIEQLPAEFPAQGRQPLRILASRFEVVDRARPHDDKEPAVFAGEHAGNGFARSPYQGRVIVAAREFPCAVRWVREAPYWR